jgi:hypothetical protein
MTTFPGYGTGELREAAEICAAGRRKLLADYAKGGTAPTFQLEQMPET